MPQRSLFHSSVRFTARSVSERCADGRHLRAWPLQDCCGIKKTLCAVLLQNGAALVVTYIANASQGLTTQNKSGGSVEIEFAIAAFLLGFADNGIMTCIYAIIAEKFGALLG